MFEISKVYDIGCKDTDIRKSEFMEKTYFLYYSYFYI